MIFDEIKHTDENGTVYWSARELASALDYKEWRNFKPVLDKAMSLCEQNGKKTEDHFVQQHEMITLAKGARREVESFQLSSYACQLVILNINKKKTLALHALDYFSGKQALSQSVDLYDNTDIIFFSNPDGGLRIELIFDGETVWTTQKRIAEIFNVDVRTVSYHINEIIESGELNKYSVIQKNWITADDGKKYETNIYNLNMIIAVGYRVNSNKATRFRQWATQTLSHYVKNGYVLDEQRFKNGGELIDKKFEQLLEKIQEIRASERKVYQKVTDIYATASDYQKDAKETHDFYAKVQNKLHWAISGQTAAEIVYTHADAQKIHMGLTSWAQAPDGKILKSDVTIAKNYLSKQHIQELNNIVNAYLDLAENRAKRHIPTTMTEWATFLDGFLTLSSYPILMDKGKISAEQAKIKAYKEYASFRVIQDRNFLSDFDKEVFKLKEQLKLENNSGQEDKEKNSLEDRLQ